MSKTFLPYYAVIFYSRKKLRADGYDEVAKRMSELGATQSGFLGIQTVRDSFDLGITISYWKTLADIEKWKAHTEHQLAQKQGRDKWYSGYEVRIAKVEKQYSFGEVQDVIPTTETTWKPPIIKTKRLILRPIDVSDVEAIFSYARNPNVSRYTLWEPHKSTQDSLNYIKDYIFDYYSKGIPEPLGIAFKETPQRIIGTVGCFWTSKQAKAMELAYAIGEEYWGQGLAAEASQAVIDYCFKEFLLKRIQARCKTENKPSTRVMEKIGMTYEGTLKSAVFHRDRFWDIHYYSKVVE